MGSPCALGLSSMSYTVTESSPSRCRFTTLLFLRRISLALVVGGVEVDALLDVVDSYGCQFGCQNVGIFPIIMTQWNKNYVWTYNICAAMGYDHIQE